MGSYMTIKFCLPPQTQKEAGLWLFQYILFHIDIGVCRRFDGVELLQGPNAMAIVYCFVCRYRFIFYFPRTQVLFVFIISFS